MLLKRYIFLVFLLNSVNLFAYELMRDYLDYNAERPFSPVSSDLIYGEGTTEITTQLNEYDQLTANHPFNGSIFVTHDLKNHIDDKSFNLGEKPLKVTFVQSTQMSETSPISVSIYHFQLPGFSEGKYTLPPISVKVGGKRVQALPITIEVTK